MSLPKTCSIINVKRKIIEFIWNTKWPKVKYQILIKANGDGGIKHPYVELRLQILWAERPWQVMIVFLNSYLDCTHSIGGLKHIHYIFDIGILPKSCQLLQTRFGGMDSIFQS